MNTMNERVREVRQHLGLTMEEFGARLGVSRAAISNIENGNRNLTSQMSTAICKTFNISEAWLQSGTGDMVVMTPDDAAAVFASDNGLTKMEEVLIREYFQLKEEEREVFRRYLKRVIAGLNETELEETPTIDEKVEDYRHELEAQAASHKSEASQIIEENMA